MVQHQKNRNNELVPKATTIAVLHNYNAMCFGKVSISIGSDSCHCTLRGVIVDKRKAPPGDVVYRQNVAIGFEKHDKLVVRKLLVQPIHDPDRSAVGSVTIKCERWIMSIVLSQRKRATTNSLQACHSQDVEKASLA